MPPSGKNFFEKEGREKGVNKRRKEKLRYRKVEVRRVKSIKCLQ
jgi:hypothetical protein